MVTFRILPYGAGAFRAQFLRVVLLLAVLASISSCSGSPIAQDISQVQANEIVAVLNASGISAMAQRETGGKGKYTVEVRRADYSQAVTILNERKLPGEARATFAELVMPSGLLPNSREMDSLRLDRALATELEDLLSTHADVFKVRAVVRVHFLRDGFEPGVSLVIQERVGRGIAQKEIMDIVSRIVPGIKPEQIVLALHPASVEQTGGFSAEGAQNVAGTVVRVPLTPFLHFWRVPEDEYVQIVGVVALFLFVVAVVGSIVGYWYSLFQHSREYFETNLPDLVQSRTARSVRSRPDREPTPEEDI